MLVTVNSVQNYSCGGPWVGGHFDLEDRAEILNLHDRKRLTIHGIDSPDDFRQATECDTDDHYFRSLIVSRCEHQENIELVDARIRKLDMPSCARGPGNQSIS